MKELMESQNSSYLSTNCTRCRRGIGRRLLDAANILKPRFPAVKFSALARPRRGNTANPSKRPLAGTPFPGGEVGAPSEDDAIQVLEGRAANAMKNSTR